jgi:hypothetical protein
LLHVVAYGLVVSANVEQTFLQVDYSFGVFLGEPVQKLLIVEQTRDRLQQFSFIRELLLVIVANVGDQQLIQQARVVNSSAYVVLVLVKRIVRGKQQTPELHKRVVDLIEFAKQQGQIVDLVDEHVESVLVENRLD